MEFFILNKILNFIKVKICLNIKPQIWTVTFRILFFF